MTLQLDLESWPTSPVIRRAGPGYARVPAVLYRDAAAGLTSRQAVFYRNLIRIAEAVGSAIIPIDFEVANEGRLYLDRGCVKIAELAGFIDKLQNDECGNVARIKLAWIA